MARDDDAATAPIQSPGDRTEGRSSTGRAPVSKTGGWGFESLRPCSLRPPGRWTREGGRAAPTWGAAPFPIAAAWNQHAAAAALYFFELRFFAAGLLAGLRAVLRAVLLRAVDLRAVDFFRVALRAVDLRAVVLRAVDLRAVLFFRVVLRAVDLRAVDRFAVLLFAGARFAAVFFFADDFFADAFLLGTAGMSVPPGSDCSATRSTECVSGPAY